jgi:hypothetical protein
MARSARTRSGRPQGPPRPRRAAAAAGPHAQSAAPQLQRARHAAFARQPAPALHAAAAVGLQQHAGARRAVQVTPRAGTVTRWGPRPARNGLPAARIAAVPGTAA